MSNSPSHALIASSRLHSPFVRASSAFSHCLVALQIGHVAAGFPLRTQTYLYSSLNSALPSATDPRSPPSPSPSPSSSPLLRSASSESEVNKLSATDLRLRPIPAPPPLAQSHLHTDPLPAPMASNVSKVYIEVIDDVIGKVRDEFINYGAGEAVLNELQSVIPLKSIKSNLI